MGLPGNTYRFALAVEGALFVLGCGSGKFISHGGGGQHSFADASDNVTRREAGIGEGGVSVGTGGVLNAGGTPGAGGHVASGGAANQTGGAAGANGSGGGGSGGRPVTSTGGTSSAGGRGGTGGALQSGGAGGASGAGGAASGGKGGTANTGGASAGGAGGGTACAGNASCSRCCNHGATGTMTGSRLFSQYFYGCGCGGNCYNVCADTLCNSNDPFPSFDCLTCLRTEANAGTCTVGPCPANATCAEFTSCVFGCLE